MWLVCFQNKQYFAATKPYQLRKILPAFLLLIAATCHSQHIIRFDHKTPQNRKAFRFKGKVKSVTECNYKELGPGADYMPLNVYQFDTAGNCVDQVLIGKGGSFLSHVTDKFDKNGNYTEFRYYSEDGSYSKTVFEYDARGNMIESTGYDKKGRLESKDKYTYDKYGNVIVWFHKADRTFTENSSYTYDDKGRIVFLKKNSALWGNEIKQWKYYKDTVEQYSKSSSDESHLQWVYNKDNQNTYSRTMDTDSHKSTIKYDAAGNPIEIKQWSYGELEKYGYSKRLKYVYDNKGNWIKKTELTLDGKPIKSLERKIEYYN